ncbi:MAG: hypothetical protein ACJ73C_05605 [Nitrososphaeraceae archaeon]
MRCSKEPKRIPLSTTLDNNNLFSFSLAQQGLETADDAIHEHPGSGSSADQGFHSGTCNGGFSVHDFRC